MADAEVAGVCRRIETTKKNLISVRLSKRTRQYVVSGEAELRNTRRSLG
jgi:malonyl CoA-acyl carrier protein transacylase